MRSAAATHFSGSSLEEQVKKRIEAGDIDLPVLPAVGARVIELVNDDSSSAQALAQLIQNDQSLAGHVMRIANSAAFNGYGKIQTLQQGIAKLGMHLLGQMALTVSVGQSVFDGNEAIKARAQGLWRQALASAAWSRETARLARCNTELAYLGGLLHQVGKAVVLRTLVIVENEDGRQANAAEQDALLERYHRVLGVSLARRWELPDTVVEVINYVDDYFGAHSTREVVMAVSAGRALAAHTLESGGDSNIESVVANHAVFRDLNFYEDDLEKLAAKAGDIGSLVEAMTL